MAYSVVGAFRDCRRDRRSPAANADCGVPRQPGPVRSPSPSTGHADPGLDQPARGPTPNELNTRVPVDLTDSGPASFNPHLDLNQKHLEVRGCWGSDVGHVYRSVQVMARYARQFPWTDLISREYDLSTAQAALEDVASQRVVKALIVP